MISIIISLYNSERYVNKLRGKLLRIAKLFEKKNLKFEVIVIFNDPKEKELKCIEKLKKEPWFKHLVVDRETVFASWNRGMAIAEGKTIAFWNADDTRFADAIIDGFNLIKNGADLVYFPFHIVWVLRFGFMAIPVKYRHISPPIYNQQEFSSSMHCGPFFMISKEFYNRVGPFDEQFKISGDFDWCVHAAKISEKFVLSKKNAGIFNVDGRGLSSGVNPQLVAENKIICQRHNIINKF
ncbi:MAG: glycosyltransferase family 2 protein [bacterium]